jgi:hypothetical protein
LNTSVDIPPDGAFTYTQEDRYEFIRQGEVKGAIIEDDFFLSLKFHVTYNAQGVKTAEVIEPQAQCR